MKKKHENKGGFIPLGYCACNVDYSVLIEKVLDSMNEDSVTKSKNDLLYCPFCGDEEAPRMMIRKGKDGWRDRFYVLCEYDSGGCGAESGWYHSEEEAKFSWNTRAKKDG